MRITKCSFGRLPAGPAVEAYTLTNNAGASITACNYGGLLSAIRVPDREGSLGNITLGCADLSGYLPNNGYLGALIGRVGNRIRGGRATVAGRALQLACNGRGHHLHGGTEGFDKKIWAASTEEDAAGGRLVLEYTSPDGEEGYPGTLRVKVCYGWSDDCALSIRYEAVSDADTLVNLTHHAYFNLAGQDHGDIAGHVLWLDADAITETDEELLPTGRFLDVTGTPFDFRPAKTIGEGLAHEKEDAQLQRGRGFDHNYVLHNVGALRKVAEVTEPSSGRRMELLSDSPGVQLYTGNSLNGSMRSPAGKPYGPRAGFCLETQLFPDSINQPAFPDPVLRAGDVFAYETIYRFSVD